MSVKLHLSLILHIARYSLYTNINRPVEYRGSCPGSQYTQVTVKRASVFRSDGRPVPCGGGSLHA